MKKKPLSLAERLDVATTRKNGVLAAFYVVADELESASDEHDALAAEARAEIDRLLEIEDVATESARHASRSATKVRDLFA